MGKQTNNSLKSYPILEFELDLWYGSVLDSLDFLKKNNERGSIVWIVLNRGTASPKHQKIQERTQIELRISEKCGGNQRAVGLLSVTAMR
jgi:hypothetical protein